MKRINFPYKSIYYGSPYYEWEVCNPVAETDGISVFIEGNDYYPENPDTTYIEISKENFDIWRKTGEVFWIKKDGAHVQMLKKRTCFNIR